MTRRSFPFSLRITLSTFSGSTFTPPAWDTTGTQLLQLKNERGTQLVNPDWENGDVAVLILGCGYMTSCFCCLYDRVTLVIRNLG